MKKVFISGSMRIKNLDPKVKERIDNIVNSNFPILLGDAEGVDSSIQRLLHEKGYEKVTIFCSGNEVRNNIGGWTVEKNNSEHRKNTRLFFTEKDVAMAKKCDYGFMVWDSVSSGTLKNVYEVLSRGKKSLVFVNKLKTFKKIGNIVDFEYLVSLMSKNAFEKADKKIQLNKKIRELKQLKMFEADPEISKDMAMAGGI